KTPLLARLPGVTPMGETCERLVSSVDISATILDLCGVEPLNDGRGVSFLPLLKNPAGEPIREYAFAEKNWHDYDASQRSVRTTRFKYMRNLAPELPNTPPADAVRSPTFEAMRALRAEGKLTPDQSAIFQPGPAEELYDLEADPHELNNLAADPAHAETLNELRTALNEWRTETADPSPPLRSPDEFTRDNGTPLPVRQRPRPSKAEVFSGR
ncbi:MAG: sulfatase/phosphatase domain-containing protein, partial [Planctomycetota bacterium]